MKNGVKFILGLCAVFSFWAQAQFFPIPADVVPYGDNRRSLKGSTVDFRFSDSTKQLLVGLTASASLPAYSFPGTGNNDNGLWRSGTDEISLVTAGQNRLTIGPTGAISFGTSVTPFVVRSGDTMTGPLTVQSGVTAQVFHGPLLGSVTGDVAGAASANVLLAGDTMSGPLRTTDTSSSTNHNANSIAADGGISAAADLYAGSVGARGALRLKCDTGAECWRLSVGGSSGDVAFQLRSILGGIVPLEVSTSGPATFLSTISATGGTMTGLLGVGTLAYVGSTSGEIKFRAPATAGAQSYQWPSAMPTSNSYLTGISTGTFVWEPIPQSEIFLQGATTYGSSATAVRRWITVVTNTGGAATLSQSAANADSVTINEAGTYAVSYCDNFNGAANMGISVSASSLTAGVQTLAPSEVACGNVSASVNIGACCSATLALPASAILRAHTDATANGSNTWMQSFRVRKLGP